jgi:hypothetical protein
MDERARHPGDSGDRTLVTPAEALHHGGVVVHSEALQPRAQERLVVSEQRQLARQLVNVRREAGMQPGQPARGREPRVEVPDVAELRAVHPFKEEPVPLRRLVNDRAVALGRLEPPAGQRAAVDGDLAARVVKEPRPHVPRLAQERPPAQVFEDEPQ